jgi:hypothetical protein
MLSYMETSKYSQASRTALAELPFGAVQLHRLPGDQFQATQRFLLDLSFDAMLKLYRELAGLPAPSNDIAGWYEISQPIAGGAGAGVRLNNSHAVSR